MTPKRIRTVAAIALILSAAFEGARDASAQKGGPPRRGAFQIATLRATGVQRVAASDLSNLTKMLRDSLKFDVNLDTEELTAQAPDLIHYPLIYLRGHAPLDFSQKDRLALRRHLDPGGGTLFVDAACGSPDFDAAFRRFVADLIPEKPLVPIPRNDGFFRAKLDTANLNLAGAKRTPAAGGKADFPDLEGVQVDGRWVVIYSKIDVGSAIQNLRDLDCKGYTHESALRIATNIVLYATLP